MFFNDNNKKAFIEFTPFLDKIIKITLLTKIKNEDSFIDIGVIYKEIILRISTDNKYFLINYKKAFEDYIKLLSIKESNEENNIKIDTKEFLEDPSKFGNRLVYIEEVENISNLFKELFSEELPISFYLYNKKATDIEKLLQIIPGKVKYNIRFIDLYEKISPVKYNQIKDTKNKLKLLKKYVTEEYI